MRLPKYKVETVANPAQPFDALYDEARDLDLGGVSVTLSENPARAWSSETNQKTYKLLWRRRWRWALNLVRINACKIGASESA
jgi:hypothetical protein